MLSATRFRASISILGIAWWASPACASDETTQLWVFGHIVAPVTDDLSLSALGYQRFRDADHGGDAQIARTAFDWKANDRWTLGGSVTYIQTADSHQWRTSQHFQVKFNRIALRTQFEEVFKPHSDRSQLRIRERVQASLPLTAHDKLLLSGEYIYKIRSEQRGEPGRVDSIRAAAIVHHNLTKHLDGAMGYMLQIAPKHAEPDQVIHAPQLGLTYHF